MAGVVKPITIEKEYEKNPDISPEEIKKLRDWLKTQPHLPEKHLTASTRSPFRRHLEDRSMFAATPCRSSRPQVVARASEKLDKPGNPAWTCLSDVDLVIVYHCCQKSIEVSKQVLDLHFTLRTLFQPFFNDRVFDKRAEFSTNTVLFAPLATPTVEGYRVLYLRLLDPEPRNFNLMEAVRTLMMVYDLWQYEEGTWPGFVILIDMDMATLTHVVRLDLMVVKKVLYFLQECMFCKLKGVHFMNAPYFMDKLLSLIKPYLKKELMDMIHTHQAGAESLDKLISTKALPKEAGGEYKDHNTLRDEIIKRLEANSVFIREENKRRVNESLRPGGKPSPAEKEFGLQGSFKKLELD